MAQYDKKILNDLLDSYEKSLLFTGKNKVNIRISFPFTVKRVPEYFDESSLVYEELHIKLRELEQKGFIHIVWKRENHIVGKVILQESQVEEIYRFLKRKPKADSVGNTLQLLDDISVTCITPVCSSFIGWLCARIREDEPVKEYIDLAQPDKTRQLLQALCHIEENKDGCYIREFSIRHFGDSKVLEPLLGLIGKVMRRFGSRFAEMDIYAILAEYFIYHTPNYIYIKGDRGGLQFADSCIDLGVLKQGVGISGEDLPFMKFFGTEQIIKVITIENLTTFFSWQEPDSILIYLGGYHNSVRRDLLRLLYDRLPHARYLHFGDIDAGGFEIYEDLCNKTGIPFQPYNMNLKILKEYEQYAKKLTLNDRKRIEEMRRQKRECVYRDVLNYMLEQDVKLEQECIVRKRGGAK
ncbi:MAG: Wadjet anti-phage system protein JetD domain-containing protein [Lachnospiraceae bacterium]